MTVGLRIRVQLTFGLLALALSALLAVSTGVAVAHFLLAQRTDTAVTETELDRGAVQSALESGARDPASVLATLPTDDADTSFALVGGRWSGPEPAGSWGRPPDDLVSAVAEGRTVSSRVEDAGGPVLVVGAPLPRAGDALFEVFPLQDVDHTVDVLVAVLTVGAVVTTAVGAALGRWASRVALRPLVDLNTVVSDVARGRLDLRVPPTGDPDLDPLAASFNRAISELEGRVRADSRFAADVGHELRTPLTSMLNSMEVIRHRRAALPASVLEPVELLGEDLDRFRVLVVDLLEISRHDAGEEVALEPVDLGELVRRAADGLLRRPVTRVRGGGLVVPGDKRRLERVVVNLVGNAETHGGGCVAVTVQRRGAVARIEVDDAGPGVPEGQRGRVFDRFARLSPSSPNGVGLGLAIVQRHVLAHGGTVEVQERPGGGARFVVELPVR
ncbi:sensor histidine kinase [Terracoccus luteus]|uniref:histidine kinase n=1 Tax=Terracoccus luteus TaxID=53356 RepID=A0A839PU18_9MICO|nr:HAMP domain-containing sensor histidine kinase [Terracoccus luteus]MBB2987640.1 signal transduction histidine kinase [Terracoccus luteus]MCP2173291.1 signal transduction histidine kinase [Terracoccus luteus]